MAYDYDVVLTRKDRSVRNFHIYGRPIPKGGEIIGVPVDGQLVKARVHTPSQELGVVQSVDHADAFEI
jgi:hypothetical protein